MIHFEGPENGENRPPFDLCADHEQHNGCG